MSLYSKYYKWMYEMFCTWNTLYVLGVFFVVFLSILAVWTDEDK